MGRTTVLYSLMQGTLRLNSHSATRLSNARPDVDHISHNAGQARQLHMQARFGARRIIAARMGLMTSTTFLHVVLPDLLQTIFGWNR